jgi:hypothetical protein
MEIQVADLRMIIKRLYGLEKMKELYSNDMVKLEVLPRRRLRLTIRRTGEIIEIG